MTKRAPEISNDNSFDRTAESSSLSQSVNSQMTLQDLKAALIQKFKPDNVCVRDQEGYITCGPIVGVQRPDNAVLGISKPPAAELVKPPKGEQPN